MPLFHLHPAMYISSPFLSSLHILFYTTYLRVHLGYRKFCTEAVFLDVIGSKVKRVFFLVIHSHLFYGVFSPSPPPLSKSGLKLVCYVNIVYGKLKSENSQDAQKPQRNCMFMNSASVHVCPALFSKKSRKKHFSLFKENRTCTLSYIRLLFGRRKPSKKYFLIEKILGVF